ncbi:hypothetical protein SNE40_004392 [Patella caerulea]|uniref:Ferric-chelate reductase 1 n=1 Tax=Patella caerulea TaxID=87958 RepID=A0AAN8K988_PATCE
MTIQFFTCVLCITTWFPYILAFSSGAPKYACKFIQPGHGNRSADPSPFNIKVYADSISPGSQVEVNISSTDTNVLIMGVLAQAMSIQQNKYVGSFVAMPKTKMACDENTGITHRQRLLVPNLNLVWNAPPNLSQGDSIIFNVTIVQNIQIYWQGVESTPVLVDLSAPAVAIPDSTTQAASAWQPIIGMGFTQNPNCGSTTACFHDCKNGQCTFSVEWKHNGDKIEFVMMAITNGERQRWISVGFSKDTKMGDDVVFECVTEGDKVQVHMSHNEGKANRRQNDASSGISSISGSYANGLIKCSFIKDETVQPEKGFTLSEEYHLMFAEGEALDGSLLPHSFDVLPLVTNHKVDLRLIGNVGGDKPTFPLVKTHGILMTLSWLVLSSIGMIMSRYGKPLWPNTSPFGIKIWFHIHRTSMLLTVGLTILALLLILIEAQGFSQIPEQPGKMYRQIHPVIGFMIVILTIANPIMALFRPTGESSNRFIFNWCHRGVGFTAFIMAVVAVFIGFDLGKSGAPASVFPVLIIYIIYHIIFIVAMELLPFIIKKKQGQKQEYSMNDLNLTASDGSAKSLDSEKKEKLNEEYKYRMMLLIVHFIVVTLLSLTLIILLLIG